MAHRLEKKPKGEVRFTPGDRALHATDGSNYRQVPIGVVVPRDEEDVMETVALCRSFGAPIRVEKTTCQYCQLDSLYSANFPS